MTRSSLLAVAALAGLGMMPSALTAGSFTEPTFNYPTRISRSRIRGRHSPAGSKLARKAAKGTVGVARLK